MSKELARAAYEAGNTTAYPSFEAWWELEGKRLARPDAPRHATKCTKCHGRGVYDDGYSGWFATPSTKCEPCNGTGIIQ